MSHIKYIVVASTVRLPTDGDFHFIPAKQLIELYGVDPNACVAVSDGFRSVARAIEKHPEAEILRADPDGVYREETMQREEIVKDRAELANLITKLEGGKSSAKVHHIREAFKKLVHLEKQGYIEGKKSIFAMLRREAVALAEKEMAKKTAKKAGRK